MSQALAKSCTACHNLDRNKIFYWKSGPSWSRMFRRYFNCSDYHGLIVTLSDLKFSASRECSFCVTVFDIFRWLMRTKGDGPHTISQPKVEICVPFSHGYPVVLTFSWLPGLNAPLPRKYDFQLAVPERFNRLPWSALTVGQQIPQDPKSSFHKAATWLKVCLREHDQQLCSRVVEETARIMPRRLLYIGKSSAEIRLIECDDQRIEYFALSYCWGVTQHPRTTHATQSSFLGNVPWSSMPKTHKDAIEFTRALGYRYIWIDSMCIIQDDRDDWNHEASCMGEIYRNAILTISATNSNHVGFGCFTERPGTRVFRNKLARLQNEPTHVLLSEPIIHTNLISSPRLDHEWPVFRRAWTLQERLLASRVVHFTAGELVWECPSLCSCECAHMDRKQPVTPKVKYSTQNLSKLDEDAIAQTWDDLALSYQNRMLSKESDRMSALSGLAQQFKQRGLGEYIAGCWTGYIISMMLWEVKSGARSSDYVAPSWAWASVQGQLVRNDAIEPNSAFEASLEETSCKLASPDPFGAIVDASITIKSPAHDGLISTGGRHGHAMVEIAKDVRAFFVSDTVSSTSDNNLKVKCIFPRALKTGPSARYIEALVLSFSAQMNAFKRIGIAHVTKQSLNHLKSLQLATETIEII